MLVCAALSTLTLTACTKVDQSKARVIDAIDRTEQVARQFTYTDSSGGHTASVAGVVQDDLRYSLVASIDGTPAASEIVVDDARALQVTDAGLLKNLTSARAGAPAVNPAAAAPPASPTGSPSASPAPSSSPSSAPSSSPSPAPSASPSPSPSASAAALGGVPAPVAPAPVPEALRSGQWVLDKTGASGLTASSSANQTVGANPLFDAITALEYLRASVNAGSDVTKFNPESETYRPKLDPFPRPASDTLRYDVVPPTLPVRSSGAGGQLQTSIPDTPFFRIMAIYVKNGLVVDAREKIDIVTRLEDPQSNLEARLGDYVNVPSGASLQVQAAALQVSLNHQLAQLAKPRLRLRQMELNFTSLGQSAAVSLPTGAVEASLTGVDAHSQLLYEQH
jgi:hypothetical protein